MSATKRIPNPNEDQLGGYGKAAILVPLIIGGAVIVSIIMLWQAHTQKLQLAEMSRAEESARQELRAAYVEMRALRPEAALKKTASAGKMIRSLKAAWPSDYAGLKVALLLMEGESLFMKDCAKNAPEAEKKFDESLKLMSYSSGEMWQFGLLGRARSRIEQGKMKEAAADLDQVMTRNPNYGAAYYWRSIARRKIGDNRGADEDEARAKALDSWPPLRDFMQASCNWTRDILCKPEDIACEIPEEASRSLTPMFAKDSEKTFSDFTSEQGFSGIPRE